RSCDRARRTLSATCNWRARACCCAPKEPGRARTLPPRSKTLGRRASRPTRHRFTSPAPSSRRSRATRAARSPSSKRLPPARPRSEPWGMSASPPASFKRSTPRCSHEESRELTMLAEVAASSLNDSVYFALVLSHHEDFEWILLASLALTAMAFPWIMHGERERLGKLGSSRGGDVAALPAIPRSGTDAGSDQALDLGDVEPENRGEHGM